MVVDAAGASVRVPDVITRIADSFPAHIEVLQMLGAGNKIVALPTSFNPSSPTQQWQFTIDPSLRTVQGRASGTNLNVESLLALHPDVLFLPQAGTSSAVAATTQAGIPTVQVGVSSTVEGQEQVVNTTAAVLGPAAQAQARKYDDYLSTTLAAVTGVTSKIPPSQRPTVLHISTLHPLTVDGSPSLIDSWITAVGGRDVAHFGPPGYGEAVTPEQILKWNPDVIIIDSSAAGTSATASQILQQLTTNPALQGLAAIRNHRVYLNPTGVFDWDYYGIEEALQIQWAAKLLHPQNFANLNMVTVVKNFYSEFFHYPFTDTQASRILADQGPT